MKTSLSKEQLAGKNLRRLLRDINITQEEFAFQYGADVRTVNRYINKGIPKVSTIQEIAEYLDVDFLEFWKE